MNKLTPRIIRFFLYSFLVLYSVILNAYELPDLGSHSAAILSPSAEKNLSQQFLQQVRQGLPIQSDPIINNYVQALGNRLVAHSNAKNRKFHFFVVDDNTINAFAGPGGYIGVNTGIILTARTESELAAVMAHEIAHVTQHHIERSMEQTSNLQIPMMAAQLAAVALGALSKSGSAANIGEAAALSTMAGGAQHMVNFTRDNESEADHVGMQTLYNSGFDPQAMPHMFEHLQRATLDYGINPPQFLLTHPVTAARISDSENRALQYPHKQITESSNFNLIYERAKVFSFPNATNSVSYYKKRLANIKSNADKVALLYGYASALYFDHEYDAAENIAKNLTYKVPNQVYFQLLLAQIEKENHQIPASLTLQQKLLHSYPNFSPLVLEYADTLIVANQFESARILLEKLVRQNPTNANLYNMLANAQAKSGRLPEAYLSRAKIFELFGYNDRALILLEQGLRLPQISYNNRAIFEAKIADLKKKSKGKQPASSF